MKFEIKHRWSGEVLFAVETDSMRLAVELAIKAKANLSEANLSEADLSKADLSKANLSKADLSKADLSKADLSEANLSKANLSWADLSKADLSWANLSEADLSWANLSEANLSKANLSKARADVHKILDLQPLEVAGLRTALIEGRVDGSTYEGECACLVGTIAHVAEKALDKLPCGMDSSRPAERFFLAIQKGDTPENSQPAKLALEWIDEWIAAHQNKEAVSTAE